MKGNKKETYEKIKKIKNMDEVFKYMDGSEDHIEAISNLVSVIAQLNQEGFTLSTAIKRDTGEIFTMLYSLKEQKAYDLECSLVLSTKIVEYSEGFEIQKIRKK